MSSYLCLLIKCIHTETFTFILFRGIPFFIEYNVSALVTVLCKCFFVILKKVILNV